MPDTTEKHYIAPRTARAVVIIFTGMILLAAAAPLWSQDNNAALTWVKTPFADTELHPGMVWNSSGEDLVRLRALCWSQDAGSARARVPEAMKELGAGPGAVAFARELDDGRYLRLMDEHVFPRRVILHAPLGAHDTHSLFLLDRNGGIINVDSDLSNLITQRRRDQGWKELQMRYPGLAMHPADRSPANLPRVEQLRGGRARVIVQYRLTDGCRACARIGFAEVAYYYESDGTFLAQKFLGVYRQPPARLPDTPADCAR